MTTQRRSSSSSSPSTSRSRGGGRFDAVLLEERPGFASLRLEGKGALDLVASEPGGHRWQRIPPNEKRGRVHTSTVTVAVLEERAADVHKLDMREVRIETYRGTGPGGQHRNKTESCARAIHVPTGIEAKSESERSQHQNKQYALAGLAAKLKAQQRRERAAADAQRRREQVGSGQRGDKVRTVREQDGIVTCERTGQKRRLREYLRGELF